MIEIAYPKIFISSSMVRAWFDRRFRPKPETV